jgi:hypothetical protein
VLNLTFWFVVVILIVAIIELLRRRVIREKYAIVWLVTALLLVSGALFPNLVNQISRNLGFQYLSNFVLFLFAILNLLIAMQLSLSLGKVENQAQTLAEEIALINEKLHGDD